MTRPADSPPAPGAGSGLLAATAGPPAGALARCATARHDAARWVTAQWAGPGIGWGARLLQPLSWLYAGLAGAHRALYRSGLRATGRAPVPVLVVGNLVAGGAGKTPAVLVLVELLRQQGWTPGVISRGHGRYGRQGDGVQAVDRLSPPARSVTSRC